MKLNIENMSNDATRFNDENSFIKEFLINPTNHRTNIFKNSGWLNVITILKR